MIAFRHAVELGADALDTDMHLTADRELVLIPMLFWVTLAGLTDALVEGATDRKRSVASQAWFLRQALDDTDACVAA